MKFPSLNIKSLGKPQESKLFLALVPALKEKRTKQFTTLALTLITVAFFGLFAINPTIGTIVDLQKQLDDNTFVNEQLQKKISNLTALQSQYGQIQSVLSPVFSAIPTDAGIDSFVGQVHQLASENAIQLNRVQTLPIDLSPNTTAKAKYLAYTFVVEGQGDIASLQTFMAKLATFDRLISFETISYTRVGKIDSTFRASFRGKTYFKPGENL